MIVGTVYGVALNDGDQRAALEPAFAEPPYQRAPTAPVIYIKTRNCLRPGGARVVVPHDVADVSHLAHARRQLRHV